MRMLHSCISHIEVYTNFQPKRSLHNSSIKKPRKKPAILITPSKPCRTSLFSYTPHDDDFNADDDYEPGASFEPDRLYGKFNDTQIILEENGLGDFLEQFCTVRTYGILQLVYFGPRLGCDIEILVLWLHCKRRGYDTSAGTIRYTIKYDIMISPIHCISLPNLSVID